MSGTQSKVIVGAAVAVGVTAASLAYLYTKKSEEPIPTKWRKVGEIIDLNFFPMKSCAPIKQNSVDCHVLGIENGNFFDRCFIISSKNNQQVTARTYPKLVLIQPKIVLNQLILSAPGQKDLILDLDDIRARNESTKVTGWYSKIKGIDAGEEAAQWISEYVVGDKNSLRLSFYPYLYATKGRSSKDKKTYKEKNNFANNFDVPIHVR